VYLSLYIYLLFYLIDFEISFFFNNLFRSSLLFRFLFSVFRPFSCLSFSPCIPLTPLRRNGGAWTNSRVCVSLFSFSLLPFLGFLFSLSAAADFSSFVRLRTANLSYPFPVLFFAARKKKGARCGFRHTAALQGHTHSQNQQERERKSHIFSFRDR
jgi:hypothetical protein